MIGVSIAWESRTRSSSSVTLHLNELKKLRIVNHIALVQEYNDVGNAYLTGKKDVLS